MNCKNISYIILLLYFCKERSNQFNYFTRLLHFGWKFTFLSMYPICILWHRYGCIIFTTCRLYTQNIYVANGYSNHTQLGPVSKYTKNRNLMSKNKSHNAMALLHTLYFSVSWNQNMKWSKMANTKFLLLFLLDIVAAAVPGYLPMPTVLGALGTVALIIVLICLICSKDLRSCCSQLFLLCFGAIVCLPCLPCGILCCLFSTYRLGFW